MNISDIITPPRVFGSRREYEYAGEYPSTYEMVSISKGGWLSSEGEPLCYLCSPPLDMSAGDDADAAAAGGP